MRLTAVDLEAAARQLRALTREDLEVPSFTVDGHRYTVESTVEAGQRGPERRYVITDITSVPRRETGGDPR